MNSSEFTEWLKLIQSAQRIGVTTQEVREFLKECGERVSGEVMSATFQERIRPEGKTVGELHEHRIFKNT